MTQDKKLVLTTKIPVRWSDMDAFGHVNNATYLIYFEQARASWWKKLGLKFDGTGEGPVVVSAQCDFMKPIVFPADLLIHIYVGSPGRSSYTIFYEITVEGDSEIIYAKGSTVIVWINYKKNKSLSLPDFMRDVLA